MMSKPSTAESISFATPDLSGSEFRKISEMMYRLSGVQLPPGKEGLVKTRLNKRLRALGIDSYDRYLKYVEEDRSREELTSMIDLLTTNKTSFFREMQHFDFLRTEVLPALFERSAAVRFWSAGCSSGEEPYSIAVLSLEEHPKSGADIRILATDISNRMLRKAGEALYTEEEIKPLPPLLRQKYFRVETHSGNRLYRVMEGPRSLVRLAKLNLMHSWPMRGPFDVIFCRNVMIYFDRAAQQDLVRRFWQLLVPGGYLFVGHSESLTALAHNFRYIQPAIYRKEKLTRE
jgi:chemotaxis protein methyltransferase CheR